MTLAVTGATGMITVQDLGRPGRMHEALPPGGALVPELLVMANRAARNPRGAAAIEIQGQLAVRAEADVLVGTIDGPRVLRAGETLALASEPRRVTYLALRGGVDAPLVLGGRGAQLGAGLGALIRAGDTIARADVPELAPLPLGTFVDADTIRVLPGPDVDAFAPGALAALTSDRYRVLPTSDRVGTRLAGPRVERDPARPERSRPMVRGAIEVPRDGAPIVLGPEHPTTGGYPAIAVIASADLGRFFAIRLGGSVRFVTESP